jgi:hypothetical protein
MDKKVFAVEARIEFKIFPRSNAEEFTLKIIHP